MSAMVLTVSAMFFKVSLAHDADNPLFQAVTTPFNGAGRSTSDHAEHQLLF
jgi:hypothetical protein